MNEKVEPVDQSDKWKRFHENKVKGNYPKWPSKPMIKSLFALEHLNVLSH